METKNTRTPQNLNIWGFLLGVGIFIYGVSLHWALSALAQPDLTVGSVVSWMSDAQMFLVATSLGILIFLACRTDKYEIVLVSLAMIVVANLLFRFVGTEWLLGVSYAPDSAQGLRSTVLSYVPLGFLGTLILIGFVSILHLLYIYLFKMRVDFIFEDYCSDDRVWRRVKWTYTFGVGMVIACFCWILVGGPFV